MENLRKYRKAKGLKQKELAELVGVSESSISQYENGHKTPSFEIALKLGEALGCESADLMTNREVFIDGIKKSATSNGDGDDSFTFTDYDKRFLSWFHSLPQEKRKAILIAQDAPEDLL